MKNNLTFRLIGFCMPLLTKKAVPTPAIRQAVVQEYYAVCARAKDIGTDNPWLNCYAIGAWFIAVNRCNALSPDENYTIIEQGFQNNLLFRWHMSSADRFLKENNRFGTFEKWKAKTSGCPYENDWNRTLLPPMSGCELAFDFTECGICKLCRDEGCFELAHYLCRLDYMMTELANLRLKRTSTLADGGEKCDFRIYKNHKKGSENT